MSLSFIFKGCEREVRKLVGEDSISSSLLLFLRLLDKITFRLGMLKAVLKNSSHSTIHSQPA